MPNLQSISGCKYRHFSPLLQAGKYFNKIECFCFEEQVLNPGENVDMPVSFFIDPTIKDDKFINNLKEITLSYTMFVR